MKSQGGIWNSYTAWCSNIRDLLYVYGEVLRAFSLLQGLDTVAPQTNSASAAHYSHRTDPQARWRAPTQETPKRPMLPEIQNQRSEAFPLEIEGASQSRLIVKPVWQTACAHPRVGEAGADDGDGQRHDNNAHAHEHGCNHLARHRRRVHVACGQPAKQLAPSGQPPSQAGHCPPRGPLMSQPK